MKKFIKMAIIASVLTVFVALFAAVLPTSAETEGNFTYTVSDGNATITDFSSSYSGALEIPSTLGGYPVTSIGDYAFSYCRGLTSITIPDSVTSIGYYAFSNCSNLNYTEYGNCKYLGNSENPYVALMDAIDTSVTNVTIHENTKMIADYAFSSCSGLISITVDTNNTTYHSKDNCLIKTATNALILGCKTSIIPDNVTCIGNYAFQSCSGLTSITIPNSVTSIGDYAFAWCFGLTSVTIPDSVTSIGGSAFYRCFNLNYTEYGNCKYLGNSENPYVALMDTIDTSVTNVTIHENTKMIADYAFFGCDGLTSIAIPDSVTSIGNSAFYNCSGLTSITIPDSVTSIGGWAFFGCSNLNYTEYGNCKYLGNSENSYVVLMDTIDTSVSNVTIHEKTKVIYDFAFLKCFELTSITIPDSVTSIGYEAFYGCTRLTSITIPNSVTSIGDCAFENCFRLTIYCYENSYAHTYAVDEDIDFILINTQTPIAPALQTKTETTVTLVPIDGYEYKLGNGKWQSSNVFEGLTCETKYIFYQRITATLGYSPSVESSGLEVTTLDHTPGVAATCTTAQICTVCDTEIAPAKGHIPGVAATCTTTQICTVCNTELVPALGHTEGAEATCITNQICTVCNEELAPALGHTAGDEATCTTNQICTVCNEELAPALGHTLSTEATCTTAQTCTVCSAEIAPALGHTEGAEATCTTNQTCTVCSAVLAPALGHTYDNDKDANCNTCGEIRTIEPEVTEPEVTEPDGTEPEGTDPEDTEPEGTDPEGTEPEGTDPEGTEPEGTDPEDTEPEGTDPEGTEPEGTEPEGTEPEGTEPEGTEPEGTEPEGTESEIADSNNDGSTTISSCASSISVGSLVIVSLLGAGVAFRKKEN